MLAVICSAVSITNGISVECNFAYVLYPVIGNIYTCHNPLLTNDGNLTHVLAITGDHSKGKSDANIYGFALNKDPLQLTSLPGGISEIFPTLVALHWNNASISSITSDDLKQFPRLQFISLPMNKLTSLDADLFAHTPKIRYFSFEANEIANVGNGLLDNFEVDAAKKPVVVHFTRNKCIDFVSRTIEELRELKNRLRDDCPPLTKANAQ